MGSTDSGDSGSMDPSRWESQQAWEEASANCFKKVDSEVGALGGVEADTVGSTAVVAIVFPSHIVVANCGDSRAVLCRGRKPIPLSVDHKVGSLFFFCNIFLITYMNILNFVYVVNFFFLKTIGTLGLVYIEGAFLNFYQI